MKTQTLDEITLYESQIIEIAHDSAKYLIDIFEADENLPLTGVIEMLAQCCMESNELLAYVRLRRYFRLKGHEMPQRFNELAADSDAFDFYLRKLILRMIELSQ